jgi:hypothetical protein
LTKLVFVILFVMFGFESFDITLLWLDGFERR